MKKNTPLLQTKDTLKTPALTNKKSSTGQKKQVRKFNPLEYLYSGKSRQQIIEYKKAFNSFDIYQTGQAEVSEIKDAFKNLGFGKQNPLVIKMLEYIQRKNGGVIIFREFLDIASLKLNDDWTVEQTNRIFSIYDSTNSDKLSVYDLEDISNDLGGVFENHDIQNMFHKADVDHDGYITQEQFHKIMIGQRLQDKFSKYDLANTSTSNNKNIKNSQSNKALSTSSAKGGKKAGKN